MFRRRPQPASTLNDVVEVLEGIGQILMAIDAKLDDVVAILKREDDEETDA